MPNQGKHMGNQRSILSWSTIKRRKFFSAFIIYAILIAATGFAVIPILWGLSTSFKVPTDILATPPRWIPSQLTVENYLKGFLTPKFLRYLFNSSLVVVGSLILSIGLATHAAYAVSRRRFAGKSFLLFLVWATIMIPGVSIIVPLYLLSVDLGIYDTYTVLILVYSAWLVPTLIWLLRGFIDSIPIELEESALIDGCTRLKTFYLVVFPLLLPGLAAAGVLVFVTIWNDFLIGFSLVLSDERRLLQVGLYSFVTDLGIEWGPLMGATIGSLIPAALVFAFMQRAFIRGITGGAVKG